MNLFKHIEENNLLLVKNELSNGVDVNVTNKNGLTLLHFASCFGYIEIIKLLLEYSVNVNAKDNDGFTPLHNAAYFGSLEIVQSFFFKKTQ